MTRVHRPTCRFRVVTDSGGMRISTVTVAAPLPVLAAVTVAAAPAAVAAAALLSCDAGSTGEAEMAGGCVSANGWEGGFAARKGRGKEWERREGQREDGEWE